MKSFRTSGNPKSSTAAVTCQLVEHEDDGKCLTVHNYGTVHDYVYQEDADLFCYVIENILFICVSTAALIDSTRTNVIQS